MRNTWFIDIDGTIVKHKTNEELDDINTMFNENDLFDKKIQSNNDSIGILKEYLLDGVRDFWEKIPKEDIIILTTAREYRHKWITEEMLNAFELRYDKVIYALGSNKRFLLNDREPDYKIHKGDKAFSFNVDRNQGFSSLTKWAFTKLE